MTDFPGGLIGLSNPVGRWGNAYLWTAVDLFFVISGFIFAHVYVRDGRLKPRTTLRSYAVARIARIYPLHLLMLLVMAGIAWSETRLQPSFDYATINYDGYHFALNLLMLQASGLERGFSFNSPAWSLTSECVCYGLFYVLVRWGGRWLLIGSFVAIVLALASALQASYLPIPSRIARGLVGFFIGVFIQRLRQPLQHIPFAVVGSLAVVTIVAAPLLDRSGVNAGIMMSFIAWPWLMLTCLHPVSKPLLTSRPMQFLGNLSYSIYLIHIPLALIFLTINGAYFGRDQLIWLAPLYIVTLILLSRISFVMFEEPWRRIIRSQFALAR